MINYTITLVGDLVADIREHSESALPKFNVDFLFHRCNFNIIKV